MDENARDVIHIPHKLKLRIIKIANELRIPELDITLERIVSIFETSLNPKKENDNKSRKNVAPKINVFKFDITDFPPELSDIFSHLFPVGEDFEMHNINPDESVIDAEKMEIDKSKKPKEEGEK